MANRRDLRVRVHGVQEAIAILAKWKQGVRNRVIRAAVNAGSTPVLKAIKQRVPKESGLLKRSIGRKMWTAKQSGIVLAIIGPRRGYKQQVQAKRGWRRGRIRHGESTFSNPVHYAHLVEYGAESHLVTVNNVRIFMHPGARAQPFIRPAWNATRSQAKSIIRAKLAEGIIREAKKYAAKGKSLLRKGA